MQLMTRRIIGGGIGIGLATFVIVSSLSGQYVPPTGSRANTVVTSTACTAGERPEWDGDSWECRSPSDYRSTRLEWVDEWTPNVCTANSSCGAGLFSVTASGAGTSPVASSSSARPGMMRLATGSTSTGRSGFTTGVAAFDFGSYIRTGFNAIFGNSTLSTVTDEYFELFGYSDVASAVDFIDGCAITYDRADLAANPATGSMTGGDFFQCVCAANGLRTGYTMNGQASQDGFTTVSQPIAAWAVPNTNIYNLEIVVENDDRARFYVNGVESCRITTNIPTGATRMTGVMMNVIKSAGTTDLGPTIDRSRLYIELPAARSP